MPLQQHFCQFFLVAYFLEEEKNKLLTVFVLRQKPTSQLLEKHSYILVEDAQCRVISLANPWRPPFLALQHSGLSSVTFSFCTAMLEFHRSGWQLQFHGSPGPQPLMETDLQEHMEGFSQNISLSPQLGTYQLG